MKNVIELHGKERKEREEIEKQQAEEAEAARQQAKENLSKLKVILSGVSMKNAVDAQVKERELDELQQQLAEEEARAAKALGIFYFYVHIYVSFVYYNVISNNDNMS